MQIRKLAAIALSAALAAGCQVNGVDHFGYERHTHFDEMEVAPRIIHYTDARADLIDYCMRIHGKVAINGPGCVKVVWNKVEFHVQPNEYCVIVTPRDGIAPDKLKDLISYETTVCKGWHPVLTGGVL